MSNSISRREFLKLGGLYSAGLLFHQSQGKTSISLNNGDGIQNILIVLMDALSAYHLSIHGYPRETMPYLSRLAGRAIVYHNHYSGGNYTTPGTASLLTGTLPWTHRAIVHNDTVAQQFEKKNLFQAFQNHFTSAYSHNILVNTQLKQFLHAIDSYTPRDNLYLGKDFLIGKIFSPDEDIASVAWSRGLKQTDDGYSYSLYFSRMKSLISNTNINLLKRDFPRGLPNIDTDNYFLLEEGIDFLKNQLISIPQPFLNYYHFLPPHAPYNPRGEFIGRFKNDGYKIHTKPVHLFSLGKSIDQMKKGNDQYDEFILYADYELNRLFEYMDQSGILDNTWVVFTSDHGELFERGITGHLTPILHQPVIRVPLLIFPPGQKSRIDVFENTSSIDVLPSLLKICGYKIPEWIEGQVLPPFNNEILTSERDLFALQAKGIGKSDPVVKGTVMLVKNHLKLMYYFGYRELEDRGSLVELYDLKKDPHEMDDLAQVKKSLTSSLLEIVLNKLDEVNRPFL